jgi:fructose-1,6-bisphosphatase II
MKNYHLDLIRATEAGAICAAEWVGRGEKEAADLAATEAIRDRLNKIDFRAVIAIGEGKKDESHGLYQGELVGIDRFLDDGFEYSIAIDPIEGTTPTAKGGYEAMSVIALAGAGALYQTEIFYMDKLAVGPKVVEFAQLANFDLSLTQEPEKNVKFVADALRKSPQHVTVCVLDRPRTKPLIEKLRKIGCRIKFISDCDVTACIATCVPDSGIDMYWSVGGAPEAVIAAAAMKCMGGKLQCREMCVGEDIVYPHNHRVMEIEDLVKGDCMFAATGITDGQLLKGVRFTSNGPVTSSIAMRSESGTIRRMITEHGN